MIDAQRRPASPASLLHTNGPAERVIALGSAAPPILAPRDVHVEIDAAFRLAPVASQSRAVVILAPSAREAASSAWQRGAAAAARAAGPGAVVYAIADRRGRNALVRNLRADGWRPAGTWLHVPDTARSAMLTPATRAGIRHALNVLPTDRRAARWGVRTLAAIPGGEHIAARIAPAAGIALTRGAAPAPMLWLAPGAAEMALLPGWRVGSGRAIAVALDDAGRAERVIKVALTDAAASTLERERAVLLELADAARAAGARVPECIASAGEWPPRLTLRAVSGSPLAALLARGALSPREVVARLGDWIMRWHGATRAALPARRLLEEHLFAPLAELHDEFSGWERYRSLLEARSAAVQTLPAVAVHGDLTMTNLLLATNDMDAGQLGLVDWEAGQSEGLPLGDLAYAAVDAVLWAGGSSRAGAYDACFGPGGAMSAEVNRALGGAAGALALGQEQSLLCLDACWVSHAANERRRSAPGEARPFLAVLERHVALALAASA